ncbi:Cysteine/Histidine-rich C1 domain-containing protein [Cinnamomum micranthum f. kanehirae]|uniref:Cysteine/Histidine-rich C1 domain-containing protein n=1 Tax=Cinnamomum micranthum f. kanehirae TaxID=337451 RepID=A0A3S3PZZ7_9MAGN|nr:Cysteine/Histidine-rich C1 domain-containing protein [Cinnamomum micranthum f. kanehirae]
MKLHGPISHLSHPQHKLKWKHTKNPFLCNGCKEGGIGNKYKCSECDFDLHEKCALPHLTMEHAFYKKCEFLFHDKIPFNMKCDACDKLVQGFGFQCRKCDYVLHPCCANLPWLLHDGSLDLRLCWKKLSRPCDKCQKKGSGWSYRSDCKRYNLHVACAKELLMEAWDAIHRNEDENKVREIQTRLPKMEVVAKNHHRDKGKGGGGKILKWARTFAVAVRVVVSALLGDPTAIIAAVASSIFPTPAREKLGA